MSTNPETKISKRVDKISLGFLVADLVVTGGRAAVLANLATELGAPPPVSLGIGATSVGLDVIRERLRGQPDSGTKRWIVGINTAANFLAAGRLAGPLADPIQQFTNIEPIISVPTLSTLPALAREIPIFRTKLDALIIPRPTNKEKKQKV